jgi:hypothetical protein
MKNFGLTRESHYKSKINWARKLIDVDLSLEDYDSDEGINSSYLLLDILVKNSERLAEEFKEKIIEEVKIDDFEKLDIKVLILYSTKFKFFYENGNNLISLSGRVKELFSLEEDKENEYLEQIEESVKIEILEKNKDFIEDKILGLLIKDEDDLEYVGNIELPDGKKVNLCLNYDEEENTMEDLEKTIQNGRKVLENIKDLYKKIYDGYVEYTLEIAQDWWKDNGFDDDVLSYLDRFLDKESAEKMKNGELTEKAYRKMIYLTDISVDFEETLSVIAYDGEWIFGGHYIYLEGNIEGEFIYGDI